MLGLLVQRYSIGETAAGYRIALTMQGRNGCKHPAAAEVSRAPLT